MDRGVAGVETAGVWEARVLPGSVARMRQGCLVWVKTLHQDVAERGFHGFPLRKGYRATRDCLLVGGLIPLAVFLLSFPLYATFVSVYLVFVSLSLNKRIPADAKRHPR